MSPRLILRSRPTRLAAALAAALVAGLALTGCQPNNDSPALVHVPARHQGRYVEANAAGQDTPLAGPRACVIGTCPNQHSPGTRAVPGWGRQRRTPPETPAPQIDKTAEELAALMVRLPDTGAHYRRADWGGWTHQPGGCDTRAVVLRRDASPGSLRLGSGCRVLAGRWASPYDNTTITNPVLVQIDHRVPVKEAAQSGARTWTQARRVTFYNDPTNLIAVSANANEAIGDRDPTGWRPTNRAGWCDYATAYIHTKLTYALAVDPAERASLAAMLNSCPDRRGVG